MLKDHSYVARQVTALLDIGLLIAAYLVSYTIIAQYQPLGSVGSYWYMLVGFTGFYLYFAWTRQLFSVLQATWIKGVQWRVFMIFVSAEVLGAAILYFVPDRYVNRWLYLLFGCVSVLFIGLEKMLIRAVFMAVRRHNHTTIPIIIFGRGRQAAEIIRDITTHPESGLRIVRKVDITITPLELSDILGHLFVEEIFFIIPRSLMQQGFEIDPYLQVCEEMGRATRVFLNLPSTTRFARWNYHSFMDHPTLIASTAELDPDQIIFKRIFDIAGALVGMVVLIGLFPPIALLIKLTSRGPIFFKQIRVGKDGKRFIIYKFRTMHSGADSKRRILQVQNEVDGAAFKLRNDPRVTPAGKILRMLSLDELPQFVNVLKGEMSLVGTRPPPVDEIGQYSQWHFRRFCIRPGMTGLWQISGRSKITNFDNIVLLDLKYIDSWSIWLDIVIILKTFAAIFRRDEAY
jgi:exopolysaccharide biosynthesis polyprenyl glycosylphosphotransferase